MTSQQPVPRTAAQWLLLLLAASVIGLTWFKPLDQGAQDHLEAGLKRSLATYAIARTINGVISVAQETGVSVQPGGVGMTFAPGQLLDPLNDLVEQFSSAMLVVSVSFGIQLLLLSLGGSALISVMLTLIVLAMGSRLWRRQPLPRWVWRLLTTLLVVRFAIPLAASGSELAYRYVMADEYAAAHGQLEQTGIASSPGNQSASEQGKPGLWDIFKAVPKWGESKEDVQERGRIEQLKARLDGAVEQLLRLVAIFVVQTLLLPLLFIALFERALSMAIVPRRAA